MKKFVSVFLILALFSTTVFAAPVSPVSPGEPLPGTAEALLDEGDLFADVDAVALTQEEAEAVEGEGFFGSLLGAVVGGIVGAIVVGAVSNKAQSASASNAVMSPDRAQTVATIITTVGTTAGAAGFAKLGARLGGALLPF